MGLEFDRVGKKAKSPVNGWMPVLGLILATCSGVLAYALSPIVSEWLDQQSNRWPPSVMTAEQSTWVVAFVLFVVGLMIAATIVAVFAPKKRSQVTDKDLVEGRKEMFKDKRRQKKRQKKMRKAALDEIRKSGGTSLK
jgi:H+/Cl- antiporter ClcA